MRKSFSGNRDAALEFVGAAQTQLMILKNIMQLGGLQQLMRKIEYPGGVIVEVAVVFGQEYMSIYAPPAGAAPSEAPGETPSGVPEEVVENVFDAEQIGGFVERTFEDTVYATGSGSLEFTRSQPSIRKVAAVGYKWPSGGLLQAFRRDQNGSITMLSGSDGFFGRAISYDGVRCAGLFLEVSGQFAGGPAGGMGAVLGVWTSTGSRRVRYLAQTPSSYRGMRFSNDGRWLRILHTSGVTYSFIYYDIDQNRLYETGGGGGDYSDGANYPDWGSAAPTSGNIAVSSGHGTDHITLPTNHNISNDGTGRPVVVKLIDVAPTVSTIMFTG